MTAAERAGRQLQRTRINNAGSGRKRRPLSSPSPLAASGADQSGVRLYNERLILSLVRRFGQLSKIEVAHMTGLSVESTSTIMNRLQADGLLKREAPLRGRVGQPTISVSLDPEGAFSIGLKIGRRSCDLVLIDFCGGVRRRVRRTYHIRRPKLVMGFVADELDATIELLKPAQRRRFAGLGVAAPFQLWNWPSRDRRAGGGYGRVAVILDRGGSWRASPPLPVTLWNDATSACAAEFFFGDAWRYHYIPLLLPRRLRRRRTGARRRALPRPHRQRRLRRLDADRQTRPQRGRRPRN